MQAYDSIVLDLLRPGYETVYAAQDDSGARGAVIALTAAGVPWMPPSGTIAMIEVRKPDGTECIYDTLEDEQTPAYAISGNSVTIIWAAQALTAPGTALAALRFYNAAGERLTSFTFRLVIPPGACPDSDLTSSTYYNILSQQIAGVLGAATHPPQIDPTTKNWLTWDQTQNAYIDSGYSSLGTQGPSEIPTTTVRYQSGSSPTTPPTGTWQTSPPAVSAGNYLWTRVVLTYSSGTTATYYSVARQGENGGGTQMTTYTGKTVATTEWVPDAENGGSATYPDFPYYAKVDCPGVTVDDFAEVVLSPDDALSGNYAPICLTKTDYVKIWAAAVPATTLTIPTIATWR